MTLDQLSVGKSADILSVEGRGALRHHLLDMGLTPGTTVTLRKVAPMGDPVELELRGYELTLRLEDTKSITISDPRDPSKNPRSSARLGAIPHPGRGEVSTRRGK